MPLSKQLLGRISLNATDFLVFDRFNLALETFDGFYLIFKQSIRKIRKGIWIKRYLSVGGNVIENIEVPKEFVTANWFELLGNLQRSQELVKFKLWSIEVFGSTCEYSSGEILVLPSLLNEGNTKKKIALTELACIEARTIELRKLRKKSGGS
jgi:hypothetical protein